jgi:hypothetical protein
MAMASLSAAWVWLPKLAPNWVILHSPFVGPALRAANAEYGRWAPFVERLHARGARDVPGLISAMGDRDHNVRQFAAAAFYELQDTRATEPLSRLLDDPDDEVAAVAALALGHNGDPSAIPTLHSHARQPGDFKRSRILCNRSSKPLARLS